MSNHGLCAYIVLTQDLEPSSNILHLDIFLMDVSRIYSLRHHRTRMHGALPETSIVNYMPTPTLPSNGSYILILQEFFT
jgi:hypothetical protein